MRKMHRTLKRVLGIVLSVMLVLAELPSVYASENGRSEGNMLGNSSFTEGENGLAGWTLLGATASKKSDGGVDINVTNVGEKDWSVQLYQDNLRLERGKQYKVSVDLVASVSRSVKVALENYNDEIKQSTSYGGKTEALQANVRQTISFTTSTLSSDITTGKIYIGLGQVSGTDAPGTITFYSVTIVPEEGQLPGSNFKKLVWSDEFDGTELDTKNWNYQHGNGEEDNNPGWGNNEWQYYTEQQDNVKVADGMLTITAKKGTYEGREVYTSARINTQGKQSFLYGKLEARIKIDKGLGVWPAFWMLGDSISGEGWPKCGEIDIMEFADEWTEILGTLHWAAGDDAHHDYKTGRTSSSMGPIDVSEWHTYGIIWDETAIRFLCDDVQYYEINITDTDKTEEFHRKHFFLFNFAVGGNFSGAGVDDSVFPRSMYVDYVRVYQEGEADQNPVKVTGITPTKNAVSLKEGEKEKIGVSVAPDNATNKGVSYSSNNTAVATVADDGTITAVKEGTTTITITPKDESNVTASVTVTVTKKDQSEGGGTGEGGTEGNLLANFNFTEGADGLTGWDHDVYGAEAEFSKLDGGGIKVNVTNSGPDPWNVPLSQSNLHLTKGTAYKVTLEATSTVDRSIVVALQKFVDAGTVTDLGTAAPMLRANEPQTVSFTTGALPEDLTNGKFYIGLGKEAAATITIRNVSVVPISTEGSGTGTGGGTGTGEEGGVTGDNMLSNSNFTEGADGLTGWTMNPDGGAATASKNSDGGVDINVTNVGTQDWSVQLYQENLRLEKGKQYNVSVDLVASVSRSVKVALENFSNGSGTSYGDKTEALQANVRQTISFTTSTLSSDIATGKIYIGLGQVSGTDAPGIITIYSVTIVPEEGQLPGSNFKKLVWSDEFEGTELNTENWNYQYGNGELEGNPGWGNGEWQYYTDRQDNVKVGDGMLTITAKREDYEGKQYTSARINTEGKQSFLYGKLEAKIKMDKGQGVWPAFWMLGDSLRSEGWPKCGEIDIMEFANEWTHTLGTLHWADGNDAPVYETGYTSNSSLGQIDVSDWHTYGIIWDETAIRFLCDDVQYYEINIADADKASEFHREHFFLFNVAVGGAFPGNDVNESVFPRSMYVDYVRVYQEGEADQNPVKVTEITPTKGEITLKEDETEKITVTVAPNEATEKGVSYSSNNTAVATVADDGTVTAVKEGTAIITITAKDGSNVTASVTVKVTKKDSSEGGETGNDPIKVTGITPNKSKVSLKEGEKEQLSVTVTPNNASNKGVSYSSKNTAIATVAADGTITAVAEGTATITITAKDGSNVTASVTVTVTKNDQSEGGGGGTGGDETGDGQNPVKVTGITPNKSKVSLKEGEKEKLSVTVTPNDATNKGVSYSSKNTAIATVAADGTITAVAEGTATITITAKDGSNVTASVTVTVTKNDQSEGGGGENGDDQNPVKVTGITPNKSKVSLKEGEKEKLSVTVTPNDATNKGVSYSSKNTAIATVAADGTITAVKEGTATIIITAKDGSNVTASVTVTVTKKDQSEGGGTGGNGTGTGGSGTGSNGSNSANSWLKVGANFSSGKFRYKITGATRGKYAVELAKPLKTTLTKVTVPATVKKNGITFKVTSIGKNAFKGNKKLTTVVIGKNVTKINAKAFYGCKKLKKVTIKSQKITSIGKQAFRSLAKNATIKVPKKKLAAYKNLLKKAKTPSSVKISK